MRIGTPGFTAARLTEAREARGFTQTVLSEKTGLKSQSISHYEQGRQSPSPEGLSLLAGALELPERFFLRPQAHMERSPVFFRSYAGGLRNGVRISRTKAERRLGWLAQIAEYVREFVELPRVELPDPQGADIERLAGAVRSALGLGSGPHADLIPVLDAAGWIIAAFEADREIGGSWSMWREGAPYLALSAGETRLSWVQYNVAHEIGHMVLHRNMPLDALDDPVHHADCEAQADQFARAFLLPPGSFSAEVWAPSINALLSLKREWRCPMTIMIRRCGELGLFSADQVRRAGANMARRGWRAVEPREVVESARPGTLAQSIDLLLRERLKDRHAIVADVGLNASDLEELCGLSRGYLSEAPCPHPAALRLRNAGGNSELRSVNPPDVVVTQV